MIERRVTKAENKIDKLLDREETNQKLLLGINENLKTLNDTMIASELHRESETEFRKLILEKIDDLIDELGEEKKSRSENELEVALMKKDVTTLMDERKSKLDRWKNVPYAILILFAGGVLLWYFTKK